jgi:hypothetical protein
MAKFITDVIDVHANINFLLLFLNDQTDFTNILLSLGKLLNVLWNSADSLIDLAKFGRDLIVLISGSRGNKFDFFVNNLLIFTKIVVSDIFNIDSEDGDNH